ncbi:hypothetical protein SAMN05444354_11413 [Stigmatella aurantiaca]|uniref:Lipoprotein n=1 Tax=Stigmatella aurantiaca TaxID=41 RepID=A0A1H7WZQ3_STIAU|nr:hypothetical protein [Stigmatella aurantiaca]SEM26447.1 hypothetical protein SAMN05444354_11413 [Stigmatella aurantiaca]
MAFRWQAGVLGIAALTGMVLQGCAASREQQAAPVGTSTMGYGGSGEEATDAAAEPVGNVQGATVNLEEARQQCQRVARDVKRYSRVTPGRAYVSGDSTAKVQLYVGRPYTNISVDCTYDARTGSAEVPPK